MRPASEDWTPGPLGASPASSAPPGAGEQEHGILDPEHNAFVDIMRDHGHHMGPEDPGAPAAHGAFSVPPNSQFDEDTAGYEAAHLAAVPTAPEEDSEDDGRKRKRSVLETLKDADGMNEEDKQRILDLPAPRTGRRGAPQAFPHKLYQILCGPYDHAIRWTADGGGFVIVDQDAFENEILPHFFRHRNLTSFQRQLNLYGFRKLVRSAGKDSGDKGSGKGGKSPESDAGKEDDAGSEDNTSDEHRYWHPSFLRDDPKRISKLFRTRQSHHRKRVYVIENHGDGARGGGESRRKAFAPGNHDAMAFSPGHHGMMAASGMGSVPPSYGGGGMPFQPMTTGALFGAQSRAGAGLQGSPLMQGAGAVGPQGLYKSMAQMPSLLQKPSMAPTSLPAWATAANLGVGPNGLFLKGDMMGGDGMGMPSAGMREGSLGNQQLAMTFGRPLRNMLAMRAQAAAMANARDGQSPHQHQQQLPPQQHHFNSQGINAALLNGFPGHHDGMMEGPAADQDARLARAMTLGVSQAPPSSRTSPRVQGSASVPIFAQTTHFSDPNMPPQNIRNWRMPGVRDSGRHAEEEVTPSGFYGGSDGQGGRHGGPAALSVASGSPTQGPQGSHGAPGAQWFGGGAGMQAPQGPSSQGSTWFPSGLGLDLNDPATLLRLASLANGQAGTDTARAQDRPGDAHFYHMGNGAGGVEAGARAGANAAFF